MGYPTSLPAAGQSAHWKRTLRSKVWSKGTDRALILVLEPAKEKGTATLKAEDNIWNYLPGS